MISNCVLPPAATTLAGWLVTVKAPALAPLSATNGVPLSVSVVSPLFWMVKRRLLTALLISTLPKSVPSVPLALVAPLRMDWLLP